MIRLGLIGLRADEMRSLTWAAVQPDGSLRIIGKARRTRVLRPGDTLTSLLARWRRRYEQELGRPVIGDDPVLCPGQAGRGTGQLYWGTPISDTASIRWAVARRGKRAGLGHVAPHDLRRSAAGMLHDARTADGGHKFDLRDIQKVLGHASPETTERSYLSQIDHDAQDRAGQVLD